MQARRGGVGTLPLGCEYVLFQSNQAQLTATSVRINTKTRHENPTGERSSPCRDVNRRARAYTLW